MKDDIVSLLRRTAADEVETQYNAVDRLINILRGKMIARDKDGALAEARTALYGLLTSPRPAVVSKACQGLSQLVLTKRPHTESAIPIVDEEEVIDQLVKALQTDLTRSEQHEQLKLQQPGGRQRRQRVGVTQALTKCMVDVMRKSARRGASRERHGLIMTLLAMNRGLLFPALSHEATCFLGGADVDPSSVLCVTSPLTAAILLQPEYVNLRGIFLLKLSTASATASDIVKLCLIVLQAELLSFCAVYTEAHADIAASWCFALANAAISLESGVSWDRASCAVTGVTISLLAEFRERGFSIAPLLTSLRSMAAAGAVSLAAEVSFLGITALQTPCIDERDALLDIIGHTIRPIRLAGVVDTRELAWSLDTLVYPVISMAATGNKAAAQVLTPLEAAFSAMSRHRLKDEQIGESGMRARNNNNGDGDSAVKYLRHRTAVALRVHRLGALDDDIELVRSCEGLRRRAEEHVRLRREGGGDEGGRRDKATLSSDLLELESSLCLLSPVILRPRLQRAHGAACAALVSVVRAVPTLGVRLLPFVLYTIRRLVGYAEPDVGGVLLPLLRVVPELGAHKVAVKQVTGTLKSLARAPQEAVRGLGLRLAARLIQINSRTFDQLQYLLVKIPADHLPPSPPEPEESRVCRVAGMLDVCMDKPELGLECVRPLQVLLSDPSAAVVALALRAIAALIRADCLDFDVALRIVNKKCKVAHAERDAGEDRGEPLVIESLVEVCGAGAEAVTMAAATESSEEDSEEDSEKVHGSQWGMKSAVEILLERNIGCHPDETVRRAVYSALAAHLPALLRAATYQEADEDAAVLVPRVRAFLSGAIFAEPSLSARSSLHNAVNIVLVAESLDSSTWRTSSGRAATAPGARVAHEKQQSGPSNRLLAALPRPEIVLESFRSDSSCCPGLAGAVLWCYPAPAVEMATARLDVIARELGELMMAEGTGAGLASCPWQRTLIPLGIQRFVRRLFATCLAAESARSGNDLPTDVAAAVEACRSAIQDVRGVPQGLVAVAAASLAACVPVSCAYVAVEEATLGVRRLRDNSIDGAHMLLGSKELFPLAAAMAARALPVEAAQAQAEVADVLEALPSVQDKVGTDAQTPMVDSGIFSHGETPASFWACVAVGVASEWGIRHPTTPEARRAVSRGAWHLITGLASVMGSDHVASIADAWFCCKAKPESHEGQRPEIVKWDNIDVGSVLLRGGRPQMGLPTTARGSRCLALFLGLCSIPAGLRATGLHEELLQLFNIVRAWQEAGVCGAAMCLPTAASECLSCGLIDSPVILDCLRSLSVALDGATSAAQDVCIGAAGLVASVHAKVVLPLGFTESMFEQLRKAAVAHHTDAGSGARVASLLALASMVGCPLLGVGEFVPRCMRLSSFASRRMVENLLQTVQEAMEGASLRAKNVGARVWGCLSAVGQDERSVEDRALRDALGWTEDGELLASAAGEFISPDALSVAREDTLMATVLTGLQAVAGGEGDIGEKGDGPANDRGENTASPDTLLRHPSLFTTSAMACLEEASPTLRVPHTQMAAVVGAIFRGGHGAHVETRCISLALALAGKHRAYSTWLGGLYRKPLFVNLPPKTRRHLVATFDRFGLAMSSKTIEDLMEGVWDSLAPTLFARALPGGPGSTRVMSGDDKIIHQAAEFLSGMGRLARSASAATRATVQAVTTGIILPSVLNAFALRFDPNSLVVGPMLDAFVELLSSLPPESVRLAISFGPKLSSLIPNSNATQESIRAYLVSRLSAGEGEGLYAVVKWATSVRTDCEACAAVLPHLAESFARINAAASRRKWLQNLLDTAGLPENCPSRAAALLGGAAIVWNDSAIVGGSFVLKEKLDGLFGSAAFGGRGYRRGSLLCALSFAAPSAVAKIEEASSGVSTEVLTRLIRVSGLLRSRNRPGGSAPLMRRVDDEEEEIQLGFEGFIRGLRHAPQIMSGTLSRQFAAYAESIAAQEASSIHDHATGS